MFCWQEVVLFDFPSENWRRKRENEFLGDSEKKFKILREILLNFGRKRLKFEGEIIPHPFLIGKPEEDSANT